MKNVIITGASRGIGFELTKLFCDKGYKVIALSRSISKLNIPNVTTYELDISCEKSILKTVKLIARTGVNRISVGSITHSAPAVDLKLEI